jgi:hypothetical protein
MLSLATVSFRHRALAGCLAVLALTLGLAACGSSASSTGTNNGTTGTQFQARLNLAKCFRAHGLNVPDPSSGGGPAGGGGVFRSLRNYSPAQTSAARTACQQYFAAAFPRLNLSPAQRAQLQQQLVKYAQCMRSHGVNVPDPTPNSGGGGLGLGRTFRSIDRNSPAFKAANTACASLRPRFGRGGGGGGGAAAPSA